MFSPSAAISQPPLPSPPGEATVIALTHCQSSVTAPGFYKLTSFLIDSNKKIIKYIYIFISDINSLNSTSTASHTHSLTHTQKHKQSDSGDARTLLLYVKPVKSSWRWNFVPAPEIDPFSTLWSIGLLAWLNTCRGEGLLAFRPQWGSESIPTSQKPTCFFSLCVCVSLRTTEKEGVVEHTEREIGTIYFHGFLVCRSSSCWTHPQVRNTLW